MLFILPTLTLWLALQIFTNDIHSGWWSEVNVMCRMSYGTPCHCELMLRIIVFYILQFK